MGLNSSDEGQLQEQARREHFAFHYRFMAKFTSVVSEWNSIDFPGVAFAWAWQVGICGWTKGDLKRRIEAQGEEKRLLCSNFHATALANALRNSSDTSFYTCTATRCSPWPPSLPLYWSLPEAGLSCITKWAFGCRSQVSSYTCLLNLLL